MNLGKQWKALASPEEATLFNKVIPAMTNTSDLPKKSMSYHSCLLDQMIDEHNAKANNGETKVTHDNPELGSDKQVTVPEKIRGLNRVGTQGEECRKIESLVIASPKKQGDGGVWRRLSWRNKRVSSKKASLPPAP